MKKSVGAIVAILVVGGILAASYPIEALTLSVDKKIIFLHIVQPNDTFLLKYLHSIELSDVWERFVIGSDGDLVLKETQFKGQGAGLPSSLSPGEKFSRQGDWLMITNMNRRIPRLYWRIQKPWNDRFRFGNEEEIDMSKKVGDALVLIQVEQIRLMNWIGYNLFGITPQTIQERQ